MISELRVALLLAGGASVRLGRDKCLLDRGGVPLLQSRVEELRRRFSICVVASDPRRAMPPSGAVHWPDLEAGSGPLPALAHALARWDEAVYLCAVDMPGSFETRLARLQEERSRSSRAAAWLFESEGFLQPIGAIYDPALAPDLRAAAMRGERSLQRFLRGRDDVRCVRGPEAINLNSREQVERWRGEPSDV